MKSAKKPTESCLTPGDTLHRMVRAAFTINASSLHEFCEQKGICHVYARSVLLGERNGPAAKELRQRIAKAAGVIKTSGSMRAADDLETAEAA